MADRLRIWEADCGLFDAVLSFTFEAEELLNCCQSAGLEVCCCQGRKQSVLGAVHRACHQDTPLARLMERRLNVVHKRALDEFDTQGFDELAEQLTTTPLYQLTDLAGKLWALTVCMHPRAPELRCNLRARLSLTGLELIARTNAHFQERAAQAFAEERVA